MTAVKQTSIKKVFNGGGGRNDNILGRVAANPWVLYFDQKPYDSEDLLFGNFMREISHAILDQRESR
ncbi:hypothetical protein PROFUN_10604 [Planoprotostelium fungivorum]|uniref:Uncharacterized protein n=1 Tax=Planoprotostelium fungivorum TaxID=1890364 RepID=A0A2P6ND52_9EUKA|nr:hypothetical protein PROFUN_10604 [Planoprotostelium fungivorum]